MRYSEVDLQCEDIMWFGVDANGYIAAFTSAGCGNVPEFVCKSREQTEMLESFFMGDLPHISEYTLEIGTDNGDLAEDACSLARKGIFSFDVSFDNEHMDDYVRIAVPHNPLHVDSLPEKTKQVLVSHRLSFNAANEKNVKVAHAY
ncbi:MAG: hypothetical protein HUJ66_01580 [Oscillospiraceae bacterium]|nr:hypothetical protein [Oscillospiraceae bacterium]